MWEGDLAAQIEADLEDSPGTTSTTVSAPAAARGGDGSTVAAAAAAHSAVEPLMPRGAFAGDSGIGSGEQLLQELLRGVPDSGPGSADQGQANRHSRAVVQSVDAPAAGGALGTADEQQQQQLMQQIWQGPSAIQENMPAAGAAGPSVTELLQASGHASLTAEPVGQLQPPASAQEMWAYVQRLEQQQQLICRILAGLHEDLRQAVLMFRY
jgi:hypothetical protein